MKWTPAGQPPVLYLSPQAVYRKGKAIRGGVPVCWRWFGPHDADRTLPAHGFARDRFWEFLGCVEDESGVMLKFSLTDDADTRRLWPHPFHLEMEMQIGNTLRLRLLMVNTGTEAMTVSGALHTYLAVGDVREVRIEGLDGAEYLDIAGPQQVQRPSGDLLFDREVDRTYLTSAVVKVKDPVLKRVLSVHSGGSGSTVVWNPWIAKARALADLPDEDYQRFVCVETANAWKDAITISPEESHTLAMTLRVE